MLMFSATFSLQQASAKPPGACDPWPQCNKDGENGDGGITATIDLIVCDDDLSIAKWRTDDPNDADGLRDVITYRIDNVSGVKNSVLNAIRAGAEEWNTTTDVYTLQETTGTADITIKVFFKIVPGFILGFAAVNCPDENGEAAGGSEAGIQSVDISLGVKGLKNTGVQNLAAHELGHALGDLHADQDGDLMFASFDKEERKSIFCPSNLDVGALPVEATSFTVDDWQRLAC